MTVIPISLSDNEISVSGGQDSVTLLLDRGSQGTRGSRIFTGDIPPTSLPPSHSYFGGITEFILGDLFLVKSGTYEGDLWEYRSQPNGNDWVNIMSIMIPKDQLKAIVAASTDFANFKTRMAAW